MPISQEIESTFGMRVLGVDITTGGAMIQIRYQVLDADKADAIHDETVAPHIIDASGKLYDQAGIPGHTHGRSKAAGSTDVVLLVQHRQHVEAWFDRHDGDRQPRVARHPGRLIPAGSASNPFRPSAEYTPPMLRRLPLFLVAALGFAACSNCDSPCKEGITFYVAEVAGALSAGGKVPLHVCLDTQCQDVTITRDNVGGSVFLPFSGVGKDIDHKLTVAGTASLNGEYNGKIYSYTQDPGGDCKTCALATVKIGSRRHPHSRRPGPRRGSRPRLRSPRRR